MPTSQTAQPEQSPYQVLEDITLQAITAQILFYFDDGELVPITLLNTAVGLLRAGKVPQTSTQETREAKEGGGDWVKNLPPSVQARFAKDGKNRKT